MKIALPLPYLLAVSAISWQSVAATPSFASFSTSVAFLPRGGAQTTSYSNELEAVKSSVLESALESIEELRREVVDQGKIIPNFGQVAETLCNQALEKFASSAPDAGDDEYFDASATSEAAAAYDAKLSELETALDAPLQLLFYKQMAYAREQALQKFRTALQTKALSEHDAMLQSDAAFVSMAQEATRDGGLDWDASQERSFLQAVLNQQGEASRRMAEVQSQAQQHSQTMGQMMQQQNQMIQQLQMQLYGQSSPWNVGVAYRIPDTNFNLQGTYQQGRANVQLSCVPDEYAPFLGPNGFTNGVGPGNLGLSLNLSV